LRATVSWRRLTESWRFSSRFFPGMGARKRICGMQTLMYGSTQAGPETRHRRAEIISAGQASCQNEGMEERPAKDHGATDPATRLLAEQFYAELLRLARRERWRAGASETLRTTALVHEAYLKLFQGGRWRDRAHFLNTAAMAMRQA